MDNSEVQTAIALLVERIDRLERDLSRRVDTLERFVAAGRTISSPASPSGSSVGPSLDVAPPPPQPSPALSPTPPTGATGGDVEASQSPSPPPPTHADLISGPIAASSGPPASTPRQISLGTEDLLRIAGVVLVGLAAVFLVSTAISRGWIGPKLQLLGATVIGFAMIGSAFELLEGRRRWASTLGVGGSAVITICAGAAYAWLELVNPTTALLLVALAAAISVAAAVLLRLQLVAVAATAAMLLVPPFSRLIVDGSVTVIGLWLGVFAVAALAIGVQQRWMAYKFISTWATALWLLVLATTLAVDGNTSHLVAGSSLVALVSAVLWLGPTLSERVGEATGSEQATSWAGIQLPSVGTALAFEHRATSVIPLWAWLSVILFGGYNLDDKAEQTAAIGLAIAGGFLAVAGAAYLGARRISLIGFVSHVLGASLLITVSLIVWLGGPLLIVALAGQALITLVIAYSFTDLYLKLNAAALAALAWLLLAVDYVEVIRADTSSAGEHVSRVAAVAALAAATWLVDRNEDRKIGAAVSGLAWASVLGLAATFVALVPTIFDDRVWLVAGTVAAAVTLAVARRLGVVVFAIGVGLALTTVVATAIGVLAATLAGLDGTGLGWPGHLAHLIVILALAGAAYREWDNRDRQMSDGLFVVVWLLALGWVAAVLVDVPQGQVGISVVWAIAACGAIVAGLGTDRAIVRHVGLGTLAVVLAKLFTVDLAEVETLWRVGLFLVIGLGLLRLGYTLPALVTRYGGTTSAEDAQEDPDAVEDQRR